MMKYCSNCGVQNEDHAKFCTNCGQHIFNQINTQPVQSQQFQQPQYQQPTQQPSRQIYTNGAIATRLVLGIISIVLSLIISFQSCAAGVYNALDANSSRSGTWGFIAALLLLSAGITGVAGRKTRGGTNGAIILYLLAALSALFNFGAFLDLIVWGIISLAFAVVYTITLNLKNKQQ